MEEFEKDHGVYVHVAWGMTERSPIGTFNMLPDEPSTYDREEFTQLRQRAGRPVFGVEIKIVDDKDEELPWDGVAFGGTQSSRPVDHQRIF